MRPAGCELLCYEGEIALVVGTRRAAGLRSPRPSAASAGSRPRTISASTTSASPTAAPTCSRRDTTASRRSGPARPGSDLQPRRPELRTFVNGSLVQQGHTSELLFPVRAACRRPLALHDARAGRRHPDGHARRLPAARAGDVVEVAIEGVGTIRNEVVQDEAPLAPLGAMPSVSPETSRCGAGRHRTAARQPSRSRRSRRCAGLDGDADDAAAEARHPQRLPAGAAAGAPRSAHGGLRAHAALRAGARGRRPGRHSRAQRAEARDREHLAGRGARDRSAPARKAPARSATSSRCGRSGAARRASSPTAACATARPSQVSRSRPTSACRMRACSARSLPARGRTCRSPAAACSSCPGDVLVGDAEGVVVIPAQLAEEIARGGRRAGAAGAVRLRARGRGREHRGRLPACRRAPSRVRGLAREAEARNAEPRRGIVISYMIRRRDRSNEVPFRSVADPRLDRSRRHAL